MSWHGLISTCGCMTHTSQKGKRVLLNAFSGTLAGGVASRLSQEVLGGFGSMATVTGGQGVKLWCCSFPAAFPNWPDRSQHAPL